MYVFICVYTTRRPLFFIGVESNLQAGACQRLNACIHAYMYVYMYVSICMRVYSSTSSFLHRCRIKSQSCCMLTYKCMYACMHV